MQDNEQSALISSINKKYQPNGRPTKKDSSLFSNEDSLDTSDEDIKD